MNIPTRRELKRQFWLAVSGGESSKEAAATVGVGGRTGEKWFRQGGGVAPSHLYVEPTGRSSTSPSVRRSSSVSSETNRFARSRADWVARPRQCSESCAGICATATGRAPYSTGTGVVPGCCPGTIGRAPLRGRPTPALHGPSQPSWPPSERSESTFRFTSSRSGARSRSRMH